MPMIRIIQMIKDFIDDIKIENILEKEKNPAPERVREIIDKAKELKGLTPEEVAVLLQTEDDELIFLILQTAHKIKEDIYGNRLVLFAPLYIANLCANNCLYCGFRSDNKDLNRVALTMDQIGALTGKLGALKGIQVKSVLTKA